MGDLLGIDDFKVWAILDKDSAVGAQTERRGGAGPVRLLLGGETHRPLDWYLADYCVLLFSGRTLAKTVSLARLS
jgi:hypothetical protein